MPARLSRRCGDDGSFIRDRQARGRNGLALGHGGHRLHHTPPDEIGHRLGPTDCREQLGLLAATVPLTIAGSGADAALAEELHCEALLGDPVAAALALGN